MVHGVAPYCSECGNCAPRLFATVGGRAGCGFRAPRTLPVERMLADERSGGFLLLRKLQQCSCPKAYLIVKFHNSRVHCVSVVLGVCASSLQLQFKMESASLRKPSKHAVEIRELDSCQAPQLTGPPTESPHRIAVGCLQKSCRGDS